MKVFDRYTGHDMELPAQVDQGRYRLLAPACLNGKVLLQAGDMLWSDGGSRCQLTTKDQPNESARSFIMSLAELNGQSPDSVTDAAVLAVTEQLESLKQGESLPSPVMPAKLGEMAQINPLEQLLDTTLSAGHLHAIAKRPRMDMRYDTEILPVSRVQRMAVDAITRLASHSEDWNRREITSVVPARLKAELSEDELAIYENVVFVRLLDRLKQLLGKRLRDLDTLLAKQAEAKALENTQQLDYRLRHDLCELWGQSFAAQAETGKSAQDTRQKISLLLGKVKQLQRSPVVLAIPAMRQVPLSLRSTNILQHDPHYRHLRPLWLVAHSSLLQQARSPQERFNHQRKRSQDYNSYVGLLIQHSLQACKIVTEQKKGISWRFGPSTLILHSEQGDWVLRMSTDMGALTKLTVVPAWRGCLAWENQKSDRYVLFCHPDDSVMNDSKTGGDSVLNPLQFYGVERMQEAIERWLLVQLLTQYPFQVKNLPSTLSNNFKDIAPKAFEFDGRLLRVIRAPDAQARGKVEEILQAGKVNQETSDAITHAFELINVITTCRLCGELIAPSGFLTSNHGFRASCGCGHHWTLRRSGDEALEAKYRLGAEQRPFSEVGSREILIERPEQSVLSDESESVPTPNTFIKRERDRTKFNKSLKN